MMPVAFLVRELQAHAEAFQTGLFPSLFRFYEKRKIP